MAVLTIVFADLTGSTALYEHLGNARAAELITRRTQVIGQHIQSRGGRVIKYLGDGVLAAFSDNQAAVQAVAEVQRMHRDPGDSSYNPGRLRIRVGLARGEVIERDGDYFGDAVNTASRLSDLCSDDQIFATDSVVDSLWPNSEIHYRNLGLMDIRGRTEPMKIYRVDWQKETHSEIMTLQDSLNSRGAAGHFLPDTIELQFNDQTMRLTAADLPVFLGRGKDVRFPVLDPRVSRHHARLERRGELFVLSDTSSYGSWVRFTGSTAVVALRRQVCVLLDKGEISMGASFDDPTAPVVQFKFANSKT
jgi:class 3 adenylate cyclase